MCTYTHATRIHTWPCAYTPYKHATRMCTYADVHARTCPYTHATCTHTYPNVCVLHTRNNHTHTPIRMHTCAPTRTQHIRIYACMHVHLHACATHYRFFETERREEACTPTCMRHSLMYTPDCAERERRCTATHTQSYETGI